MNQELSYEEKIEAYKSCIKEVRKKQVQIQNKIKKQEDNDIYDESLYDKLDKLDGEIALYEQQIEELEKE